ncbi:hypothetical protein LHL20_10900 [Alteromonas sp. McT4-15]|uniref:hypothetical protein n=1 Tax=Alteromonas sp. McT4-15 TaxID=2881256 RepID=UPI001CF8E101|nr:hypothetical protein [Alteromonas sp. McT4-15]MCB4436736.1 hypothetical protein [Alteromonas sp. McT4-15]
MAERIVLHDSINIDNAVYADIISRVDEQHNADERIHRAILKPASVSVTCHLLLALIVSYSVKKIVQDQSKPLIEPIKAVLWSKREISNTLPFSGKAQSRATATRDISNQVPTLNVAAKAKVKSNQSIDGAKKVASAPVENHSSERELPLSGALPSSTSSSSVHSIDNIKQATQTYIDNLNREALSALPTSSTAPQRQRKVLPLTSDELLRASIEITVNCDTWTGQLFASLSKNRGVVLEDRDFPTISGDDVLPPKGSVVCSEFGNINHYINKRLTKGKGPASNLFYSLS